jgi:lysozyme family protein
MLIDNFDTCLAVILQKEGGYSNNKLDPGGMTNLGVTRRVWEAWTRHSATELAMRALKPATVAPLYRKNYWQASGADRLPAPLGLCVFDMAVNAGPGTAVRLLQGIVGAKADGQFGRITSDLVDCSVRDHGLKKLVTDYQEARRGYYRTRKTFKVFGRGWLRRVDEVEAKALGMVK